MTPEYHSSFYQNKEGKLYKSYDWDKKGKFVSFGGGGMIGKKSTSKHILDLKKKRLESKKK